MDEAVLGLHYAALGIGEGLLRCRVGFIGGRGGGLSGFLASLRFPLVFRLGPHLAFRLGLQLGLRRADLLGALLLVGDPSRHLLAALVRPESGVLAGVRRRRLVHPTRDLGFPFLGALGHPLVAHRLALGGVGFDLRSVQRHMAELDQARLSAQLQHLRKQRGERLQTPLAEVADRAEVRDVQPDDAHEVDALARRLGPFSRRAHPIAIAVQQRRIVRRLTAFDAVDPLDLFQIEFLDHEVQTNRAK